MKSTTLTRDSYGALHCTPSTNDADRAEYLNALATAADAARAGQIAAEHNSIEWDRKRRASGSACHHEVYDIHGDVVLLCVRHSAGSKYGVSTTNKEYFILRKGSAPVVVNTPARAAKSAGQTVGEVLRIIGGLDK